MSKEESDHLAMLGFPELPVLGRHQVIQAEEPEQSQIHPHRITLFYLHRGFQFRACDGFNYPVRAGQGILVLPGQQYSTGIMPVTKGDGYWLQLDLRESLVFLGLSRLECETLLKGLQAKGSPWLDLKESCQSEFQTLWEAKKYSESSDDLGYHRFQVRLAVLRLLNIFIHAKHLAPTHLWPTPDFLSDVMMDEDECVEGPTLAKRMGISLSRLRAIMKERTGMSLGDWLLRRRIDQATMLLVREKERSVTNIALECGFSSSQYFATAFKRHTAITPLEFRNLSQHALGLMRLKRLGLET